MSKTYRSDAQMQMDGKLLVVGVVQMCQKEEEKKRKRNVNGTLADRDGKELLH